MGTHDAILAKWEARRTDALRASALVPLGAVVEELLADLQTLRCADDDTLSIREAAELGGYSEDHLRRAITAGQIPNAGRKHKPAIRRADVPRKPGYSPRPLPSATPDAQLSPRRRIVLEATTRTTPLKESA